MKTLMTAVLIAGLVIAALAAVNAGGEPAGDEHAGHGHGEEAGATDHGDEEPTGGHADHDHEDSGRIVLSERDVADAGLRLDSAGPGHVYLKTRLLGKVRLNEERVAHVVPPVSGVVREVRVRIGESVSAGEVLAVIASRELAEARAQYLSALGRQELASVEFARQKELWEREIMAEQDYLDARQALAEADIALSAAEQTLHALGVGEDEVRSLTAPHEAGALTELELRAPLGGTIIEMHMVTGEVVSDDSDVLVVADLSKVWIDLDVPQVDLPALRTGQGVVISCPGLSVPEASGVVSFVSPIIDEETRTALARVEIANHSGEWRPGLFVTADVSFERASVPLLLPKDAVQTIDDEPVVFVPLDGGFVSVPVVLGRSTSTHVEVVSGLAVGDTYVGQGAYALKAEVVTSGLGSHAGHGH